MQDDIGATMTVRYALNGAGMMLAGGTKELGAFENTELNSLFPVYSLVSGTVDVWTETAGRVSATCGSVAEAGTGNPTTIMQA